MVEFIVNCYSPNKKYNRKAKFGRSVSSLRVRQKMTMMMMMLLVYGVMAKVIVK